MAYPTAYRYTKDHAWVDLKGEVATIGITDYAQSQLNDVVFVDLPRPGKKLEAGKPLGMVESVKASSDIEAPVSGEVVEANTALKEAPETINSDPHGGGWLAKVGLTNPSKLSGLMDAAAYETYIAGAEKKASA
jgi:glycine cleavage system H protein